MASNIPVFPRMLKMLRENSNIKDKREALTYIRSNSKKLEQTKAIKEEQYKELYKLVIDVFANGNNDIQNEAYETLNVIIRDFRDHSLNLFETMSQLSQKTRLKLLKLLEIVEDSAISTVAYDAHTLNFFKNCMCTIQANTMPWIASNACTDNIQALTEAENKQLSDDQRLEEETINYSMILLRRLYKVAAITSDTKVQRFHALLLEKIMLLAYMGHRRQRIHALKLLEQSLATDITSYVRTKLPEVWTQYKSALQSIYCKRMLLLVSACELDWATQWNVSIQFLGVDLHRGAGLINNLLSVEEKAFKSTDTVLRRQAFLSWKLLVDNFALDPHELATARRIKLLCVPLNAKNSKSELIALTKLEVWWHVIIKLYKDISDFVNPVITQFLNFCFGPLGDTPLISSKFEIVASPGKRFYKTKIIAIDALCQLLVSRQENNAVFSPVLEERLPHSLPGSLFQECYKCFIHSIGEAWLILSQLTDAEMKNRHQIGKILWSSLVNYIQESRTEVKEIIYKDLILVITELTNCATDKPMIKNLIFDTILPEIVDLNKNFDFEDDLLLALILKLVQIPLLNDAKKPRYDVLNRLFMQCIKSHTKNEYYTHALKCLKEIYEKLSTLLSAEQKNEIVVFELWRILAEVLTTYMDDLQEINEGNAAGHNLKTVESIVIFPFMYMSLEDHKQIQELIKVWKQLYKQLEMRADLIETVKSNEILLSIANAMQCCIVKNEKSCRLITKCLDTLLSTVNYKFLLANVEVPSIIHLIIELISCSLSNSNIAECEASLKALSAVLITIYGHNPQKVISYLQVCKPAIELILSSKMDTTNKEIISTWETIVSIFKGLNKLVDYDLLLSYKKAIILALNHRNLGIQSQAMSLFDLMNVLSGNAKSIFQDIETETCKDKISRRREGTKKADAIEKSPNQIKMVGSFLNRRSCSPKAIVKETIKTDKKASSDTNSEDYVFIKTDVKYDVSRLTDHQKESLKRKRDDIPALYNDLSQSSSQDTQNLQEWFDKKNDALAKKDSISMKTTINDDANKENKLRTIESEIIDKMAIQNDAVPVEHVGQNTKDIENNENLTITDTIPETCDNSTEGGTNFSSQEERFMNKGRNQCLSPSILDSGKRRNRHSAIATSSISQKIEETNSPPEQFDTTIIRERNLRTKRIHKKNIANNKLASDSKSKLPDIEKRGVKRKATSDSESEGTNPRRRCRSTDRDSPKFTEVDTMTTNMEAITEDVNLSQRTKNEISRLRINMVFDTSVRTSRRSKGQEDDIKEVIVRKQSPETRTSKPKTGDKTIDSLKKNSKINDKELNKGHCIKRGNKWVKAKLKTGKNNEFAKSEDTNVILENKGGEAREEKKLEEVVIKEGENKEDIKEGENKEDIKEGEHKEDIKEGENPEEEKKEEANEGEQEKEENKEEENLQIGISKTAVGAIEGVVPDVNEVITPNIVESKDGGRSTEIECKDIAVGESIVIPKDITLVEQQTQTEDDTEDIIENSQDIIELQKKCSEKQCFIKINKIGEPSRSPKLQGTSDDEEMASIVSNTCDNDNNEVPKDNVKESEENIEGDSDKPKISTPTADNLYDNGKYVIVEVQKINEGSVVKSLLGLCSPKNMTKRQLKFKTYAPQGRAAHMLGLVTKQAKMESECYTITIDDEAAIKKLKIKDTENETVKKADKLTATCSSRQEKIFNNMKSSDFCPSPPIKLFSNLKNDGEKIFSNVDKIVDSVSVQTDAQVEKLNEESSTETEELPILEWSSANPPSLTASPSVSILKRQRQSLPEPDPECMTPNKRKRVSFADPPVSKEMGYEIDATDSAHKLNKFLSRGLNRKDSPMRMKPIKPRLLHVEAEKMECEEETDVTNVSELDLQCERENELLTKIAEDLEYSENFAIDADNGQVPCNPVENELTSEHPTARKIDNLNGEFEVTQNTTFSTHMESKQSDITDATKESDVDSEHTKAVATGANNDLFNGVEGRHDNASETESNTNDNADDQHNVSAENRSVESLNYNIVDDSVIQSSYKNCEKSENLEDTVEVQNISSLNSTANSDEIFCGKLVRTSTKAVDLTEEEDTLPVTDSVLASLPSTNDSQNASQFEVDIPDPDLLNSTQPIYPSLISCPEPIKSIVEKLTNPLWVRHLVLYLENRNLETIGDLAQLSEREVNRMPVKGKVKVELVKSVLKQYEAALAVNKTNNATERLNDALDSEAPVNENANVPVSKTKATSESSPNEIAMQGIEDLRIKTEVLDSPENIIESSLETGDNVLVSNISTPIQMTSIPVSSILDVVFPSQPDSDNFSLSKAMAALHTTKTSKDPSKDPLHSSKPTTSKINKSVEAQTSLADLLDEIDVNVVLESAVRRCTPERILMHYKNKMRHVPQMDLETETIRMLATENRPNSNETTLKYACRACGLNKVLLRLPDIFAAEKQFFVKLLNAYRQKIKTSDCMNILDFDEVKEAVCQKCASSELAEMLSKKLKEEEQEGIRKPMTELSSLDAMLKRMPIDVIISHTVANDELIPSRLVLDIALQNNSSSDIAKALESQSSDVTKNVFYKLWSDQFAADYIAECSKSNEGLLKIFKAVASKLSEKDLLQAFYECMNSKLKINDTK